MSKINFSDEAILTEELKKGNNEALAFLFKNYYSRLYGYARRFITNEEALKDIIQECFIKLWENRESIKSISIQSLLFVIVRNGCLNYLKHASVVNKYQIDYLANIKGEERLYHADFLCDTEYSLLYEELQREVKQVIERLPKKRKEVFLLSRFGGLKNREIAEKLQISTTAVEKHIAKAIKNFENHFKKKYPVNIYIIVIAWLISSNI